MGQYRTAQVTQSSTPAVVLFQALEDALGSHASWEKVGVYRYSATATYKDHLWRCKGAANDWGQDWYLWLTQVTDTAGNPTGSTDLYVNVSESYTEVAQTPVAARPLRWRGPDQNNGGATPAADGSYAGGSIWPYQMNMYLRGNTTNFTYRLMVTRNNVFVKLSGTGMVDPSMHLHCGLYESFYATHPQEFPLFQSNGSYPSNGYNTAASVTRSPGNAGVSLMAPFMISGYGNTPYTRCVGTIGEAASALIPPRTAPVGSRLALSTDRGLFYDVMTWNTSVTPGDGDTVTLPDGTVYEYFGSSKWMNRSAV